MMEKLVARGDELARLAQQRQVRRVAQRLRALFGGAAVTVEETHVFVSSRGIVKRWLVDPSLRFIGGGLK